MQILNVLHAARWKYRTQKIAKNSPSGHHRTNLSGYIFATKACIDNRKKLLNSNVFSTCPHNMVNFCLLATEICWRVSGNPANVNGFRVLTALLHGTLVVGVSQTFRRWTEGATCTRQGSYHVGHWPTFLVCFVFVCLSLYYLSMWIKVFKGADTGHTRTYQAVDILKVTRQGAIPVRFGADWGVLDRVHIGATWRIRLNRPCAAAMRPYAKLLWPLVKVGSI